MGFSTVVIVSSGVEKSRKIFESLYKDFHVSHGDRVVQPQWNPNKIAYSWSAGAVENTIAYMFLDENVIEDRLRGEVVTKVLVDPGVQPMTLDTVSAMVARKQALSGAPITVVMAALPSVVSGSGEYATLSTFDPDAALAFARSVGERTDAALRRDVDEDTGQAQPWRAFGGDDEDAPEHQRQWEAIIASGDEALDNVDPLADNPSFRDAGWETWNAAIPCDNHIVNGDNHAGEVLNLPDSVRHIRNTGVERSLACTFGTAPRVYIIEPGLVMTREVAPDMPDVLGAGGVQPLEPGRIYDQGQMVLSDESGLMLCTGTHDGLNTWAPITDDMMPVETDIVQARTGVMITLVDSGRVVVLDHLRQRVDYRQALAYVDRIAAGVNSEDINSLITEWRLQNPSVLPPVVSGIHEVDVETVPVSHGDIWFDIETFLAIPLRELRESRTDYITRIRYHNEARKWIRRRALEGNGITTAGADGLFPEVINFRIALLRGQEEAEALYLYYVRHPESELLDKILNAMCHDARIQGNRVLLTQADMVEVRIEADPWIGSPERLRGLEANAVYLDEFSDPEEETND